MSISVVMPAYNAERFIAAALDSLLPEAGPLDLEILVVDDHSTDGTRAIVERYARAEPRIRLLDNPRKGIAAARNTAVEARRPDADFVAFLDSDDLSYPGRLTRQRAILDENPEIDVLYGRVEMFGQSDPVTLGPLEGSRTRVIRGPYLQSALYRAAVFAKVGRFDETFRQGCDTDYVLRVVEAGARLVLDDGIAAYYRRHDANVTLDTAEMRREFMLASLKWAARNRLAKRGELPEVFHELFLRRDQIEKDLGA